MLAATTATPSDASSNTDEDLCVPSSPAIPSSPARSTRFSCRLLSRATRASSDACRASAAAARSVRSATAAACLAASARSASARAVRSSEAPVRKGMWVARSAAMQSVRWRRPSGMATVSGVGAPALRRSERE